MGFHWGYSDSEKSRLNKIKVAVDAVQTFYDSSTDQQFPINPSAPSLHDFSNPPATNPHSSEGVVNPDPTYVGSEEGVPEPQPGAVTH